MAAGAPAEEVLAELVALVEQQAEEMACSVQILDEAHRVVRASIAPSLPVELSAGLIGQSIGEGKGACGHAAWSGQRVITADIATHPNWEGFREYALAAGWRGCWSNPIKSSTGDVLGTFAMYYRSARGPSEDDVRWVETATHLASIALERAEALDRLSRRQQRLERLTRFFAVSSQVNEAIVRVRDPQRLYERACEIAVEQGQMRMAWVGLLDETGLLVPTARAGAAAAYLDEIRLSINDPATVNGPAARAVLQGRYAVSNDIAADDTFVWGASALAHGLRSCATFPLSTDGRAIGMIAVYAEQAGVFNDDEVRVLAALADNLSFAVESAQREAERQAAVRAREQAEAQLLRAQRLESIGTLAGGIAHDFNNILAAILGNAGLVAAELTSSGEVGADPDAIARALDSVDEIEHASARASDLVARILTFSRQQEPQRRPLDLPEIADEALQLLRATLPAMIEIEREYDPDTPTVMADATQIHQVLMNLGTNAAHAMGRRHGTLTIALTGEEVTSDGVPGVPSLAPGDYARISVRDTGHGMYPDVLDRIFEPFYTTKDTSQGTGLGLSVVHGIVRNHGGTVRVTSTPGQGTTFDVWLPVATEALPAHAPSSVDATQGHGERLIVVDDESSLMALNVRMFEHLGYRVAGFSSGAAALEHLAADPSACDVLLTDSAMPGLTGLDLIRQVRRVRPDLPTVLMSGYFRPADLEAAAELGVTLWQKPGKSGDLGRIVCTLLQGRVR
jgi:signal transduction histidine kinase